MLMITLKPFFICRLKFKAWIELAFIEFTFQAFLLQGPHLGAGLDHVDPQGGQVFRHQLTKDPATMDDF